MRLKSLTTNIYPTSEKQLKYELNIVINKTQ